MRRILSLWFPRLAIDRFNCREHRKAQAAPGPRETHCLPRAGSPGPGKPRRPPLVLVAEDGGQVLLRAVDDSGFGAGLRPGMALSAARALVPGLRVHPADPAGDLDLLARFADGCGRYSPWVSLEGEGEGKTAAGGSEDAAGYLAPYLAPYLTPGIWLDITGVAGLFGGEEALGLEIIRRFGVAGFACRAAIADSAGAAWAISRFGAEEIAIIPPGGVRRALAPLPVRALRLPPAIADGLARMGLRRIGELYSIARAPLANRFGPLLNMRIDQALARRDESITPRRPVAPFRSRLAFAEPIAMASDIAGATAQLVADLVRRLGQEGRGLRQVDLAFYRVDNKAQHITVGTGRASRDGAHLLDLLRMHLERVTPGFGIEVMVLSAVETEKLAPAQLDFGTRNSPRPDRPGTGECDALVDRLANRLGRNRVAALRERESHIPERAEIAIPAHGSMSRTAKKSGVPPGGAGQPRPLRLFARPEAIEAVAPIPDGPPALIRWRGTTHRIRAAEGPERIAPEWWRADGADTAALRDYYRVEDTAGRRFWVYRNGVYGDDCAAHPGGGPRWYLHGVFG